jgi:very-short-patch-repair endonuclease
MAAVLACGPWAVLSHCCAAALLGIGRCSRTRIDVTAPGSTGRRRRGIRVHSGATLTSADVTRVQGLPTTTIARTLLDLAATTEARGIERMIDQAEVMGIYDGGAVADVLERAGRRRGTARLRTVLESFETGRTHTELEELFLAACRKAGLPRPRVNQWMTLDGEEIQIDFLWPAQRVAVETDGWATHRTRGAFEADRRRDQRLAVAGWRPVRFTWRQVANRPREVVDTLRPLLAH